MIYLDPLIYNAENMFFIIFLSESYDNHDVFFFGKQKCVSLSNIII